MAEDTIAPVQLQVRHPEDLAELARYAAQAHAAADQMLAAAQAGNWTAAMTLSMTVANAGSEAYEIASGRRTAVAAARRARQRALDG
jgi:hypothetical protein